MNLNIKFFFILSTLFANYGCQATHLFGSKSVSPPVSGRCPEKPQGTLEPKNVKSVLFVNETASTSDQLRSGESIGYRFQGEAGKTLRFQTKEDICIWVFSPTNKVITDFKLPETAQYIIEVAAKQGSQSFSLQMNLSDKSLSTKDGTETAKPISTKSPVQTPTQTFSKSDFPKTVCGDSRSSDPSVYPITFYPVNLPDTESNLRRAQSKFCADSYRKKSKETGEKFIQVASFIDQKNAKSFADLVASEITGAVVGSSTTVERSPNK